jgi:hypothetical protein
MPLERRIFDRYRFSQGHGMRIVGAGGKWECPCTMVDVSEAGARLRLGVQVAGLDLSEFTLILSKTGNAQRKCAMVWQDGDYIGVRFLDQPPGEMPVTSRTANPVA